MPIIDPVRGHISDYAEHIKHRYTVWLMAATCQ